MARVENNKIEHSHVVVAPESITSPEEAVVASSAKPQDCEATNEAHNVVPTARLVSNTQATMTRHGSPRPHLQEGWLQCLLNLFLAPKYLIYGSLAVLIIFTASIGFRNGQLVTEKYNIFGQGDTTTKRAREEFLRRDAMLDDLDAVRDRKRTIMLKDADKNRRNEDKYRPVIDESFRRVSTNPYLNQVQARTTAENGVGYGVRSDEVDQEKTVKNSTTSYWSRDSILGSSTSGYVEPVTVAQSLVCRESVINYVINATNAKDECEGLKKAFDKTCSNDDADESEGETKNQVDSEGDSQSKDEGPTQRRKLFIYNTYHRKLFAGMEYSKSWKVAYYDIYRFIKRWLIPSRSHGSPFFFPENEVVGDAWKEARYQVKNNIDFEVNIDIRNRLLASLEQHSNKTTTATATKHSMSLDLPTSKMHVSEKLLSETLTLHQEKKLLKAVTNATNSTTRSEAIKDAAVSSKALSDTTDMISAILNDPTSVEARTCCASILNVYHEHCSVDEEEEYSDKRLFLVAAILVFCGMVKSIIRHYKLRWLPEAGGCILVGALFGFAITYFPHHDLSFDGNWFLRIMVPPIVFEAALSIDKSAFNRFLLPILIYAVGGTLVATYLTGWIVHRGTIWMGSYCATIPYVESLTFGALISSIDPIAVLSVLNNLGMSDTDAIYVLIFGESLLNDGVSIVLFHTLVHFLDENIVIDGEAIFEGAVHFVVVFCGSLLLGIGSGMLCTIYFAVMHGMQTPLVEVLSFFCWALLPYYVCDGIGWSGIVSVVATGFIMDIHVVGRPVAHNYENSDDESETDLEQDFSQKPQPRKIFSGDGYLSDVANTHIHFVAEILSSMMETSIFAYLGLFLFNHRYHWNLGHTFIAILSCLVSRAVMISSLSTVVNCIARFRESRARRRGMVNNPLRNNDQRQNIPPNSPNISSDVIIIDKKMQTALWVAGLRGAMSFALVEHVPLYDAVTGEGSRMKPELKAMTSASILFTVFVLGGITHSMIERMGLSPSRAKRDAISKSEIAPLKSKKEKALVPRRNLRNRSDKHTQR